MTELRGICGGDSEGDVLTFAVFHGFGGTIKEGDWSRAGVTEVREEEGEGEDEGEAIQESGKYVRYCEDVVAAPDEDVSDEAGRGVCSGGWVGVEGRDTVVFNSFGARELVVGFFFFENRKMADICSPNIMPPSAA